ncbi:hypothetical protein E2651_38420 [Streptomyces sp. MZ04]|nr:hypothetical protein E2651_38420 [Streptomyces sp. MZ04]
MAVLASASLAASTPAFASGPAPAQKSAVTVETADVSVSGLPKKCSMKVKTTRYLSQGKQRHVRARAYIKCESVLGVRVDLTLFKGKKPMKTRVCEKHADTPGKPPKPRNLSCSRTVDLTDKYKGKQTWRAKAEGDAYRYGSNGSQSKWSNKVKS